MFDSDYPYTAEQDSCQFQSNLATTTISNFSYCSNYSSSKKKHCSVAAVYALLAQGPISVGIDAGSDDFQNYSSGVYTASCTEDDHAVIAIGYGNDAASGSDYWLIRNSWGADWGDNGYIKVAVNDSNNHSCFVNNEAYLPVA